MDKNMTKIETKNRQSLAIFCPVTTMFGGSIGFTAAGFSALIEDELSNISAVVLLTITVTCGWWFLLK
jgi:hypothetical protein